MSVKCLQTVRGLFVYVLLALVSSWAHANPKGAMCVIKANNQVVLVKEIYTGKWSLPGGLIEGDEDPAITAQRETWEEAGLIVTARTELFRNDKGIYFDCVSESQIIAFKQQDALGGHLMPIWFAPHYSVEVAKALLISPADLQAEDYRYPQYWPTVLSIFPDATLQTAEFVDNLIPSAPSFQQFELTWLAKIHALVNRLGANAQTIMQTILSQGLMFSSALWLVLLPLCYAKFGRDVTLKLSFTLLFGYLLVSAAQISFAMPRPYVYAPLMDVDAETGFGMPNLALTLWSIAFTIILPCLNAVQRGKAALVGGVLLFWLVLSLFYTGNAFLVDSLIAMVLGWLCGWHVNRLNKTIGENSQRLFSQKGIWLVVAIAAGILASIWHSLAFVTVMLAGFAMLVAIAITTIPSKISAKFALIWLLLVAVIIVIYAVVAPLVDSSGFYSLLIKASALPIIILASSLLLRSKSQA